jgi:hypothetical protein
MRASLFVLVVLPGLLGAAACVEQRLPPPPPPDLPEPQAPLPARPLDDDARPPPSEVAGVPRPRPTGDREKDALELGFWGCRVMGARLAPSMSGRAVLRATLGPSGEVLDAVAERVEDLPRPVVDCLLQRLSHARFDPRGGYGSIVQIPVDFTRPADRPLPTMGTAVPTQSR